MFKFKPMVVLPVIFFLLAVIIVAAQQPKTDTILFKAVAPKVFLDRALQDSMVKLGKERQKGDSLDAVIIKNQPKVTRHLARLIKNPFRRRGTVKPDTVYMPIVVDLAMLKPDTVFSTKTDTVFVPTKRKGIFGGLFKNKTKN